MTTYPEHGKLKLEKHKTEIIHEFLTWLEQEHEIYLRHEDGSFDASLITIRERDNLMAEFIGIDLKKLDAEKEEMLNEFRDVTGQS